MAQPIEEIRKFRIEKIKNWLNQGKLPYPEKVKCSLSIEEALKNFSTFRRSKKKIFLCGRIFSFRDQGKIVFLDLKENTTKIQVVLKRDETSDFNFLKENLDIGDLISAEGVLFVTKKGERSLLAKKIVLAAKSLRPIPSTWYGLADVEERYRKRYLDLLINQEVRKKFDLRFKFIEEVRKYLWQKGFLEIETPILQVLWGGANARPFKTFHNALKEDLYLRIAPELYLKRLLVGGYEKIFEIGKNFRNEGMDREHNPEFTMLELYWAWQDLEGLRKFVERMIKDLVKVFFKDRKLHWKGKILDFSKKFPQVDIVELVKKETGIDFEKDSPGEIIKKIKKLNLDLENSELLKRSLDREALIGMFFDPIFKKVCRPKIIQPTFLLNHPIEISPLAKADPSNPNRVLRFQLIIAGMEVVNAFSELNNPLDQESRFKGQEKLRKLGEDEAQTYDKDFLEALEYGMPPTAGLGIGLDRLIMLITDSPSLKEIILFPFLKKKEEK